VRNEHITPKSAKSIAKKIEAKQQKQQKVSYKNDSTRHAVKRTFASQFPEMPAPLLVRHQEFR
jgi:hypothetical protein